MEKELFLSFQGIFQDSFTSKDIHKFLVNLQEICLLDKENVKAIKGRPNLNDQIGLLLRSVWSDDPTFFGQFFATLKITFGQEIGNIVNAAYKHNETVLWLLDSYVGICQNEAAIRDILRTILKEKLPGKKWQMHLFSLVVTTKATDFEKFITALEKILNQHTCDSSYESSTMQVSLSPFAEDITNCLTPLLPLLNDCIGFNNFQEICSELKSKKHLSKKQTSSLRKKRADDYGNNFEKLLRALTINAQSNWKWDFLRSLELHSFDILVCVTRRYFLDEMELLFLVSNWNQFKLNEDTFKKSVQASVHRNLKSSFPLYILDGIAALHTVASISRFKQHYETLTQKTHVAPLSTFESEPVPADKTSLETPLPDSDDETSIQPTSFNFKEEDKHDERVSEEDTKDPLRKKMKSDMDTISKPKLAGNLRSDDKNPETDQKMEVDDPVPLPGLSYAAAVRGEEILTKKETASDQHKVLHVKEHKEKIGFDHYFDTARLAEKYMFTLEFQAIAVDGLQENECLCVHLHENQEIIPMHFNSLRRSFSLVVEVSRPIQIYKYLVVRGDQRYYEFLAVHHDVGQIRDRKVMFVKDGFQQRHMIKFDVVMFSKIGFLDYCDIYSNNVRSLWPSFQFIAVDAEQKVEEEIPFFAYVKMFSDWFASMQAGVNIVTKDFMHPDFVPCRNQPEKINNFLVNEAKTLVEGSMYFAHARRVLGTIAVIVAMKLNGIHIEGYSMKRNICNGLSLHDVETGQIHEIHVQLVQCYDRINKGSRSFKSKVKEVLDEIFLDLLSEPECLLFLPIYTVVMNAESNTDATAGLKIPSSKSLPQLKKHLRQFQYQRSMREMASQILALSLNFPKMKDIYQDILSPQSVCDLMATEHSWFQLFDIIGIFKKLNYFWGQMLNRHQTSIIEIATVLFNMLLKLLEDIACSKTFAAKETDKLYNEILGLTEKHLKMVIKSESPKVPPLCIGRSFDLVSHVIDFAASLAEHPDLLVDNIKKLCLEALESQIIRKSSFPPTDMDIELWNILTEVTWNKSFAEFWAGTASASICTTLTERFTGNPQRLLEFYAEDFEKMRGNKLVNACFMDVIVKQVEKSLQENVGFIQSIRHWFKPRVAKLCSEIFLKHWETFQASSQSEYVMLKFVQQWPPACAFFKLLCTKDAKSHHSEECKAAIKVLKQSVLFILDCLQRGDIPISTLKQIFSLKTEYLACFECTKMNKTQKGSNVDPNRKVALLNSVDQVNSLLAHRMKQVEFFQDTRKALDYFLASMASLFQDNILSDIESVSEQVDLDTSGLLLSHVIECQHIGSTDKFPMELGNVILFSLTLDVLQEIVHIHNTKALSSDQVRHKLKQRWNELIQDEGSEDTVNQMSVSDFLLKVWSPVRQQILDTVQRIDNGSILVCEVDELFGNIQSKDVNSSLKILYDLYKYSQVKMDLTRVKGAGHSTYMVNNYLMLRQNQQQAKRINALRLELKLEGAFTNLDQSLGFTNELDEKPLSFMTKEVVETVKDLQAISKHEEVITACIKHITLIKWLKENMKNISEVKVMSDLAMISAGETPMEVDRVSCFLSAVIGFSPLIFDLPRTADWKQFLRACNDVGKNANRDPKLLKKWKDTAKQLEWLKTTKDLHGSVEKSSLKRAQMINLFGNYIVGGEKMLVPVVEDCLQMKISKHQPKAYKMKIPDEITMRLGELRDLQSRLMLIAGEAEKGKHDVDRFIAVLSVVEKLTKAYLKLRHSGCLLFSNWRAIIRCNDGDDGVTVQVFFDEKSPAISSREKVIGEVHKLTTVLEEANKTWLAYLGEKRTNHYHLNHFNIHQLTYLCKSLANAEDQPDFHDQVYCLLASVLPGATYEDIIDTLDDATRIKDDVEIDDVTDEEETETETKIERKKKIVRQLIQGELSESVAKAAVQAVKSLDLDDCYLWALENEFDEAKVVELHKQFEEEMGFKENWSNIGVVKDVLKDQSDLTLKEVIEHIQHNLEIDDKTDIGMFVNTTCERYLKGTSVTSLSDCVSLEHVGIFLSQLSALHRGQALPRREWADQFESGRPNLVVCTPDSVWRNVLSIYAKSPDQPLPSASEVLVCSETTTAEEVGLLLRRAISRNPDDGRRIYCLACAEQLSFTTAKEVEQYFQHLTQSNEKNDSYRLVVVSSNSQHYMTTCFDEHQVAKGHLVDEADLKRYVKRHLRIPESCEESVAMVDDERSSIRLVYSEEAGNGKSLYIQRCRETVREAFEDRVFFHESVLRFLDKTINVHDVTDSLYSENASNNEAHFIHVDVTPAVGTDANKFLFDLLFLGSIQNSHGVMWRRQPRHFYAIEYTQPQTEGIASFMHIFDLIPSVTCLSPRAVVEALNGTLMDDGAQPILMDNTKFHSEVYQRPYQYLSRHRNREILDGFTYTKPSGTPLECLTTLLQFCSIERPSWAELHHFSSFLNVQLRDCENSIFCNVELVGIESQLIGFKSFVVRFMIRMSQDFATSSLGCTNRSQAGGEEAGLYELHQLRRRWESRLHPYLFFNDDSRSGLRTTMSFVHFNIIHKGETCDLCHPITNEVEEEQIMTSMLHEGLRMQRVSLQQNFDNLARKDKLSTLCSVFGQSVVFDPDPTYELTTDNVLKMLAIHMRFRCDIPVVIMGETGCGKTRMVEFMSKLKAGHGAQIRNMLTVKVHGGITVPMIQQRVRDAAHLARENGDVETVLFLDEANTTEAIYAIKEVICDKTVHGTPFHDSGLKIVAACNPYRKHSDEEIQSMENCGLGFNVKTANTQDKFASIPMRHLVYRVIPLPPSMQPMVWDFGQLNNATEEIYIRQMVLKVNDGLERKEKIDEVMLTLMTKALAASQEYMRNTRDVCRFVSLRDVERSIKGFKWFYSRMHHLNQLIDGEKGRRSRRKELRIGNQLRAFIQALGMCYHTTLNNRTEYRELIASIFNNHFRMSERDIEEEIIACQSVFMNSVEVGEDIACNEALRENVFMMIICAEMRIPLFLVGKPGSSKSLAKTIVTSAMQGKNSANDLFKNLKQIHVSSFQCSAVSDAVGIEAVFNQCAQIQSQQDLEKFVAVVVLDEIGLAEDSPKMPLKVLHPLLEIGSTKHTVFDVPEYNKVGFVGISNWALDPAKMNRGIFVTRGEPTKLDLRKTAEAFFKSDKGSFGENKHIVNGLTDAYQKVCEMQAEEKEFFGLRDYYGLLKMLFKLVSREGEAHFDELAICVLRNFGGYKEDVFDVFRTALDKHFHGTYRPNIKVIDLVQQNLNSDYESRFLLLLTKQYSAVSLLSKVIQRDFQVIFGSSFPRDHDYTEICRNINRIKVCMESGKTVVLLNLRDLYESLYDALNQQYVTFADQRYVDLGLGGHRVKCRIADNFRLIVIEEKEVVYNEFPIPLINRLEKHVFEIGSVLNEEQKSVTERLDNWARSFANVNKNFQRFTVNDAFVGFQEDTAASVALTVSGASDENVLEDAKFALLQTASLDSVVRLSESKLEDVDQVQQIYTGNQSHETLQKMLASELVHDSQRLSCIKVFEVVSFSMCLNEQDRSRLETVLELRKNRIMLVTLQQLQTEEEYMGTLDEFFQFAGSEEREDQEPVILLIQCPQAQLHANLIACAKYTAMNKVKEFRRQMCRAQVVVAFLFSLERSTATHTSSFTTYHSSDCVSVYVDELRPGRNHIAQVGVLWNLSVSETLETSLRASQDAAPATDLPVDVLHLLKVAIPDAMACLANQHEKDLSRNRVKILNQLCFDWRLNKQFVNALMSLVVGLMRDRERTVTESWIVREACSRTSLQEGGSFRNALWLRLKQLISLALARIVSVADSDKNLDILCHESRKTAHVVNLWFTFFASYLCRHQWSNALAAGNNFIVNSQKDYTCQFPFSRAVVEELKVTWTVVHQLKGDNPETAFLNKVKSSPLRELLANATHDKGMDVIVRFTHDLTHLLYKAGSNMVERERTVVREAISMMFAKQREVKQQHYEIPLLEIFTLVMKLRKDLELFADVVASHGDALRASENWLDAQKRRRSFCLHVHAFHTIVQHLRDEANGIDKVDRCHRWKELVCKLKKVADTVLNHADAELATTWSVIRFVELFLDQLVPANSTHSSDYLKTLAPLARRLWKGASTINSLADVKFLNIITKALLGCTKDVQLKMLCSWGETKCRSCRTEKVNRPVRLPCGHFICYRCVTLDEEGRNCPGCRRSIPDVHALAPVGLSKQQKKELDTFKSACTSFFLEYLSTFCFPDPDAASQCKNLPPPDDKILLALEKLVICDKRTQKISPHLSTFDTNPTARSYILQLLMRCDKDAVINQLNEHFSNMAGVMEDRGVLMDIYLQCSQDMLGNRSRISQFDSHLNTEFAHDLLHTAKRITRTKLETQVEQLDACSMLLYISRVTAESIHLLISKKIKNLKYKRDLQMLVDEVCAFTRNRVVMKQFIVKYLCRRFGIDAYDVLLDDDLYRNNLLPQNLIPQQDGEDSNFYLECDNFVLSGKTYVRVKDSLFDIVDKSNFPGFLQRLIGEIQQGPDSVFQIMLALSTWAARATAADELRAAVYDYVCKHLHMHLTGGNVQQLYNSVRNRELDEFRAPGVTAQMQYKLTDFLTLVHATLQSSTDRLVAHLQTVVTDPFILHNQFLPTMPASNFFLVRSVMQQDRTYNNQPPKAYQCPNGHVYFIGECTNPNQAGRCPDCGRNIGGRQHGLLHEGNRAGELTEESQAGYCLKPPGERGPATPERRLTMLSVCAIRACLHAALVLAVRRDENAVGRVVKVNGGREEVARFLMGQLVKDLTQLAESIGKSMDDALLLMHRILHDMRTSNAQMNDGQCNFRSMATRERWEEEFQRRFLSLVFRDTDAVLDESRQTILDAGKFAEKPLHRLVYEINPPQLSEEGIVEWNEPALWKYRNHIDLQHLKLRLEAVDENARGDGAILKVMLNMEDLSLIQHIDMILEVQAEFIAKYRNKVDIQEADKITLEDFLGESDQFFIDELRTYCEIWNKVRMRLMKADRYNTTRKFFYREMEMDSPISMCLPSDQRRGCCALVLVEYLIELQNELLCKCRELVVPAPEFQQIDAGDVSRKHLICVDERRDLMPLILANSQYEATVVGGRPQHSITYNLPLLQRKVVENFLLRKCIIKKETIPRMSYPQDVGLRKDCEVMQERFTQVPLPVRLAQAVDTAAQIARKADICEAVRYVTLIIQFLAKLGGSDEQTICEYAEKELTLPADETGLIPRSAKITHCLALYERLSWHRSLLSVKIGQDPFELIHSSSDEIPEKLVEEIKKAMAELNVEKLQLELNSLMMVGPELQEHWSIADALYEYVEGRNENADWCLQIPRDVLVKHSRQLFAISMKHAP